MCRSRTSSARRDHLLFHRRRGACLGHMAMAVGGALEPPVHRGTSSARRKAVAAEPAPAAEAPPQRDAAVPKPAAPAAKPAGSAAPKRKKPSRSAARRTAAAKKLEETISYRFNDASLLD